MKKEMWTQKWDINVLYLATPWLGFGRYTWTLYMDRRGAGIRGAQGTQQISIHIALRLTPAAEFCHGFQGWISFVSADTNRVQQLDLVHVGIVALILDAS